MLLVRGISFSLFASLTSHKSLNELKFESDATGGAPVHGTYLFLFDCQQDLHIQNTNYQKISFRERREREKHLQSVISFVKYHVTTPEELRVPMKKWIQGWQKLKAGLNNMQFNTKRAVAVIIRQKKMTSSHTGRMRWYACQIKQLPVIILQSYLKKNTWKKICLKSHIHTVELASERPGVKK